MNETQAWVTLHSSEYGGWERASGIPDQNLQPYVMSYEGYRDTSPIFLTRLEVAMPAVVLIINFGPPYRLSGPVHPSDGAFFSSFVAGLTDTYTCVASDGPTYSLQVNFTPLGAFRFFDIPMHELANRVTAPTEIDGALGEPWIEQLHEASSWQQRFCLLDEMIYQRLACSQERSIETVAWAWRQLHSSNGKLQIGALAEEAGCSSRHFIKQFREQVGLPPKALARLLRFHDLVSHIDTERVPDWSRLARENGYFDQAHFIKDFRKFAGVTPREFHRRLLPGDGGVLAG